jgi:hypothetical protein
MSATAAQNESARALVIAAADRARATDVYDACDVFARDARSALALSAANVKGDKVNGYTVVLYARDADSVSDAFDGRTGFLSFTLVVRDSSGGGERVFAPL